MIFYFTGTGNSLALARAIAQRDGDALTDIGAANRARLDRGDETFEYRLPQGADLGIVFPVMAWTTPGLIDDFVRRLHITAEDGSPFVPGYAYCAITCGAFVGNAARFLDGLLRRYQGFGLDASFSAAVVGNCVYLYDVPGGDRLEETLAKADERIAQVAERVAARERVHAEKRNGFGCLMSTMTCREDRKTRDVAPFHVTDACVGCGTCAEVCPTETIHMVDGRPVWEGTSCTQCLACLHRCPAHASQYGGRTERRGRYLNPSLR